MAQNGEVESGAAASSWYSDLKSRINSAGGIINFVRGKSLVPEDSRSTECLTVEYVQNADRKVRATSEPPISVRPKLYPDLGSSSVMVDCHFGTLDHLIRCGKKSRGRGHTFEVAHLLNPTWCDHCGEFIWGFFTGHAVRCSYCMFTCHFTCTDLVTLDCRKGKLWEPAGTDNDVIPRLTLDGDALDYLEEPESEPDDDDDDRTEITSLNGLSDVDLASSSAASDATLHGQNDVILESDSTFIEHLHNELPVGVVLERLVDTYNATVEGPEIVLDQETKCCFSGFVQVHMNLTRPINIIAGEAPPSIYDIVNPGDDTLGATNPDRTRKTITSFFLPRNTLRLIHITSETTVNELIVALLKKFKVADNPAKFALYYRDDYHPGKTLQTKLFRISDGDCPLRLVLKWGSKLQSRRFVLQENETGDFNWDAFEVPELNNFMRILDREEEMHRLNISQRYDIYRFYLHMEIRGRGLSTCAMDPEFDALAPPFNEDPPAVGDRISMFSDNPFVTAKNIVLSFGNDSLKKEDVSSEMVSDTINSTLRHFFERNKSFMGVDMADVEKSTDTSDDVDLTLSRKGTMKST